MTASAQSDIKMDEGETTGKLFLGFTHPLQACRFEQLTTTLDNDPGQVTVTWTVV